MKNRTCYVVGADENYGLDFQPNTEDFVITADAGLHCLEKQGIRVGYTSFHIYCGTGGRIDHTSNEFIGRESSISVSDGTLFIVFLKEAKERIVQ